MTTKNNEILLKVENVKMDFNVGGQIVPVLKGISLEINKGDFAVIFGPSGCGKSTLLHCILGMEKPTSGRIIIDGVDMGPMVEDDVVKFRKSRIGIVFQQPIWIKSLTVLENVSFPNLLKGKTKEESQALALTTLKEVKLDGWANYNPSSLSGGQQQRVSLARALTLDPLVIVADEPTGNLDTVAGDELINLLVNLNKEKGKTIIMVTHDLEYLKFANKLFHMVDGELVEKYDDAKSIKITGSLRTKKGKRTLKTVCNKDYLESGDKVCE